MLILRRPSKHLVSQFLKLNLFIGIPAFAIAFWLIYNDPNTGVVEEFLKSNTEIAEKIGSVDEIKVRKITTLMRDSGIGTAKEPWQKVYRLIVKGGKSIAHVRVRIYFDDEDELGNIEIERIDLQT